MAYQQNKHHFLFDGFSKLSLKERKKKRPEQGWLTVEELLELEQGGISIHNFHDELVENALGWFAIPLGISVNFRIDQKDFIVPMVIEESSVIASVSKAAKWIKNQGTITTEILGKQAIGQIQILVCKMRYILKKRLMNVRAFY